MKNILVHASFHLLIGSLLVMRGCSTKQGDKIVAELPGTDSSHYTILSYDKSTDWMFVHGTATSLNKKELADLHTLLVISVAQHNRATKDAAFQIHHLEQFYSQYTPVGNAKGQKEVFVNAFCEAPSQDWRHEQILVQDGGNCYFQIKINLTTGAGYDCSVNGDA